jgi:anti-sigma factor RsiW
MACREYEDRILEMHDGGLSLEDRRTVEAHLAVCSACRRFADCLEAMDASLAEAGRAVVVSPDFKTRLLKRIDVEPCGLSAEAVAARRRDLEAEFETAMAGLLPAAWRRSLPLLLEVLGFISATFIAVKVASSALGGMPWSEAMDSFASRCTSGSLIWAWTAAAVAAGLRFTYGRRLLGQRGHVRPFSCGTQGDPRIYSQRCSGR